MNPKTRETAERLNLIRILLSVPEGLLLTDLQKASGIHSVNELKKALGQLYMLGAYPYTPLDLLEIDFDGDRARLIYPFKSDKTLVLTPKEWLILRNSLEALLRGDSEEFGVPKNREDENSNKANTNLPIHSRPDRLTREEIAKITSILERIKKIVPYATLESFKELKALIREAIQSSRIVRFDYLNREGTTTERRMVNPIALMEWNKDYLLGYCHTRKENRIFRLESLQSFQITEESFDPPKKSDSNQLIRKFTQWLKAEDSSSNSNELAEIWHTRGSYYYLNEIFHLEPTGKTKDLKGHEYILSKTKVRDDNWFVESILGFLPEVIVESPKRLNQRMKNLIQSAKVPESII
jgi:predicted DNA-binding transcriptional regulator YafY